MTTALSAWVVSELRSTQLSKLSESNQELKLRKSSITVLEKCIWNGLDTAYVIREMVNKVSLIVVLVAFLVVFGAVN